MNMDQNLLRQVRILQAYAVILTIALILLAVVFLRQNSRMTHFKEIDAQRINIVDSNGSLRMVISNPQLQHPGAIGGKMVASRDRPAGMIFFNDDGDECGGLIYDGNKKEASFTYSIDQYRNDQIMQWQYAQDNSTAQRARSYGLKLWDRPDAFGLADLVRLDDSLRALPDTAVRRAVIHRLKEEGLLGSERLFLGRTPDRRVGLFIRDMKGRPRIEIGMDSTGKVMMHALDTLGRLVAPGS